VFLLRAFVCVCVCPRYIALACNVCGSRSLFSARAHSFALCFTRLRYRSLGEQWADCRRRLQYYVDLWRCCLFNVHIVTLIVNPAMCLDVNNSVWTQKMSNLSLMYSNRVHVRAQSTVWPFGQQAALVVVGGKEHWVALFTCVRACVCAGWQQCVFSTLCMCM
jgi:hypothetical protein